MNSSIDSIMTEKKYEHIKKYEKLSKTADNMIRMMDRTHRSAYQEFEGLVTSEDGKEVDLEKFKDDEELQERGVQKMKEVYINQAKKVLKAAPIGKFEEELLMNAYAGTTETELRRIVTRYKHKLTSSQFRSLYEKEMKPKVTGVLKRAAGGHLTEKHVDDLLEYSLHPDALKHLKGYVTLDQAKILLNRYTESETGEKLGLNDVVNLDKFYKEQDQEILPSPLVKKLEKAIAEKKKKDEEERAAA